LRAAAEAEVQEPLARTNQSAEVAEVLQLRAHKAWQAQREFPAARLEQASLFWLSPDKAGREVMQA
jgi:hypothetical protein